MKTHIKTDISYLKRFRLIINISFISILLLSLRTVPVTAQEPLKYRPYSSKEVKVLGVTTKVMAVGLNKRTQDEPVIILQSGALVPMEYWTPLISFISNLSPLIAYDRPGAGGSSFNGTEPTPEYIAGHLHELLKAVKVPPPYILVGHSWGGPLILYYAGKYPEEVAGMVYVDPTDPGRTPETFYMTSDRKKIAEMKAESDTLAKGLLNSNQGAGAEYRFIESFFNMPVKARRLPENPSVPTVFIIAGLYENPGGLSFMDRAWHKKRLDLRIDRFRRVVHSLPQATLIIASDTGHNIPMEAPDLIAGAIHRVKTQIQTGPP